LACELIGLGTTVIEGRNLLVSCMALGPDGRTFGARRPPPCDHRPTGPEVPMKLSDVLPLVVPLVVLQLILIVLALRDLVRPERQVRGGSKALWAIVIVLGELIGPLVYFFIGRVEE
jgi:Phospholipase_D-nuclease N-terminal